MEQLAFAPSHLVPGIEPSPDKMLQGRLFSYADTHRHRLGKNYQQLPVNCPYSARVANYQRDGPATFDNQGSAPNYFPNSFGGPAPTAAPWSTPHLSGDVVRNDSGDEDNFSQCGVFFRKILSSAERERLTDNIAGHLINALERIQVKVVANFSAVDANYGAMLQRKLDILKAKKSPSEMKKTTTVFGWNRSSL